MGGVDQLDGFLNNLRPCKEERKNTVHNLLICVD